MIIFMYLFVRRITEMKCPYPIVAEGAVDWTHFTYIHKKSHARYKLLQKSGSRSIFYYKARTVYPLPFFKDYIVFREELPEKWGYRQIYYDLKKDWVHYLTAETVGHGETTSIDAEFYFRVSPAWKYFSGLFFWIFKRRMRAVMREDNVYMSERIRLGVETRETCEVVVPEKFDLFEDFLKNGIPDPFRRFKDHVCTDLTEPASV